MTHWWRAYDDAIDHPKLLKLSDAMHRAWFTLQCIASANGGVLPPVDDIATRLRIKPAKVAEWIAKLVQAKLIDNDDGVFQPHNWSDRQYQAKGSEKGAAEGKGKYVYFIRPVSSEFLVKIGHSKNPWARVGEIQTSHPEKLELIATFKCKEASEADLHILLADYRRNGEWFDLPNHVLATVATAHAAKSDYASLLLLLRSSLRIATTENIRSSYVVGSRTEQIADSNPEQSRAEASAPVDEDLKRKASALAAGVSAHFVSRNQPIPNLDRCLLWLTQGYAAGTVLAAVEMVLKRGKVISTLEYFDGAIQDQHAKVPTTPNLQIVSQRVWVDEGTQEWSSHQTVAHERTGRGTPVTDQRDSDGRPTGRRGWYFATLWAEGFNDFGERIQASSEDAA